MNVKSTVTRVLAVTLSLALVQLAVPRVNAASHLVDPSQVAAALVEKAQSRQEKIELFQKALATPEVQAKGQSLGLDAAKLSRAIPHLSDAELADLATRAQRAQDITAGHYRHHNGDAALIIIGVTLLVAGLIILAALADEEDYWDDDCCW